MITSACLIFNPVAGQRNPDQDIEQIKFLLESAIALDIIYTTPEVDAAQLARERSREAWKPLLFPAAMARFRRLLKR